MTDSDVTHDDSTNTGATTSETRPGPLAGLRIIDFTWAWAGPYGVMILRMLGADVVKVESRTRLDQARVGSIALGRSQGNYDQQPMFNELNLGKRSLALNLKAPGATDVVKDLYRCADAVMDNFRPGTLDKLGLGYDVMTAIRADHILVSASALGAEGPERTYGGYAPTFAALAGLMSLSGHTGEDPMLIGGTVDLRVGTAAALALLAAMQYRRRTGRGMFVDHSAREAISILIGESFLAAQMRPPASPSDEPQRLANGHQALAPYGLYRCAGGDDAFVAIGCRSDADWDALLAVSGLPLATDPRFATGLSRWKHRADLDAALAAWTRDQDAETLAARLLQAGIPASATRDGFAVYDSAQFRARGGPVAVDPPAWERRLVVPPPWRLSRTPASIPGPAPALGADNHGVLRDLLGYDAQQIAALEASGALE